MCKPALRPGRFLLLASLLLSAEPVIAQTAPRRPTPITLTNATYAAALRGADGHVDGEAMAARITELGVKTYYWLIWRDTDWNDLKAFLPKAAAAGIEVWPYLVPPSESPPNTPCYSEPFRLDYRQWAEEIARLSLEHPNLTAWVIDDFYANKDLFTPEYVRGMQERAGKVNPKLAFLPLMYFGEIDRAFAEAYGPVVDGVVAAYPRDRTEIEAARAILDDRALVAPGGIQFPAVQSSAPGDFGMISQTATVLPSKRHVLRFRELDDFAGTTCGYHFKQVLLDNQVAWEQDATGGGRDWENVEMDVTEQVRGKTSVTVGFRVYEKQGVANFPLRWRLSALSAEGLDLAASLEEVEKWTPARQGAFELGFGGGILKRGAASFHIPLVIMTAAQDVEFRLRHGDPVTPERVAEWLRMCLQCQRDGLCEAVVTYCLDLDPAGAHFGPAKNLFLEHTN